MVQNTIEPSEFSIGCDPSRGVFQQPPLYPMLTDMLHFRINIPSRFMMKTIIPSLRLITYGIFILPCAAYASESLPYRAAIFTEPDFPVEGHSTPAQTFVEAFTAEGIECAELNASQLSDPTVFHIGRFDLLVVPTGASFPLSAKETLLTFLQNGGDLFCAGGYAFDRVMVRQGGRWIDYQTIRDAAEARARDPQYSRIPNGGFEEGQEGWTTSQPALCTITDQEAYAGSRAALVVNQAIGQGARWERPLDVTPGETYLIGAHAKTRAIQGTGYAYLAVYQYGANGRLLHFVDFTQFKQDQDWQRHEIPLAIDPQAARVMFYGGFYLAGGSFWFDEVTCARLPQEERINAHFGIPEDGLRIQPTQLTVFSPDQPIQGTRVTGAADGPLDWRGTLAGDTRGWDATAQLRQNARWVPLLEVQDDHGRSSGAAAALVNHYAGPFARSRWVLSGVTNRDLFAGPEGQRLARSIARLLRSGVFIRSLTPDRPVYAVEDTAQITLDLSNAASHAQHLEVALIFETPDFHSKTALSTMTQTCAVAAQSTQRLTFHWKVADTAPDFVALKAVVKAGDSILDTIRSGFCVQSEKIVSQGTKIRYQNNAFELTSPEGITRRVGLWGTDTYGNYFQSPTHSPWTWFQEIQSMRDHGLHLFENLQFIPRNQIYTERQWQQLDAFIQLCQRFSLPYMAGLLIGQDVVAGNDELTRQAEMCRQFAARYKHVPGLIYYLNGDFQLRMKDTPDIRRLWNDFLQERYGSEEALKQAWKVATLEAEWGNLPARDYYAQQWYDVQARDRMEFQTRLMRRWIQALCQAIRQEDPEHPITSEYYQRPFSGIDLRLTLGGMDAANFGYFDQPGWDLARLMAVVKWNDMRWYGKTVNIGEFGVKTHEAWKTQYGAAHYHIQRTPDEQLALFWWVPHTAWAMGVTKIQNWCWSDDPDRVFPWGIAWNNPLRAKPAAQLYRNLRLLSEMIHPEYTPADTVFVMPDTWRLGAPESLSYTSLMNALDCLLAANIPFDVINEASLAAWSGKPPRLLIAPLAYALPDAVFHALKQLAMEGACVYLSGDPSTTPLGMRDPARLEQLCGVKSTGTAQHRSGLPLPLVKAASARKLDHPGQPAVYENAIGQGRVLYAPEPWETFHGQDLFVSNPELTSDPQKNLYLSLTPLADVYPPAEIHATTGVWRITEMKSSQDTWITLLPRSSWNAEAAVAVNRPPVSLQWTFHDPVPAGVLLNRNHHAVAATGSAALSLSTGLHIQGGSPWMMISLDQQALSQSEVLLLCTMRGGTVRWDSSAGNFQAEAVEWRQGSIVPVYPQPIRRDNGTWEIDTEPNELYLVTSEAKRDQSLTLAQDLFLGQQGALDSGLPE